MLKQKKRFLMRKRECKECGAVVRVRRDSSMCSDCHYDSLAPTQEQIAEECRKIREEGHNRMRNGLGEPEGEYRSVRVYKTPRF